MLEAIHGEKHIYELAQLVSMAVAVDHLSQSPVQVEGFVAGSTTAVNSLLRLLVESKLTMKGRSHRIEDQASLSTNIEEDLKSAQSNSTTTYESLAIDLSEQFDTLWEVSLFEYAFRFVTGTHQLITPDQVIVCAAALDSEQVAQLDKSGQLELLTEAVYESTYEDHVEFVVDSDDSLNADVPTVTQDDVIRTHRKRLLTTAHEAGAYSLIPVVATAYPGGGETCSLSALFRNLYVLHSEDRVMYLDTDGAGWAQDTLLLNSGMHLWQYLNDTVIRPIYDEFDHLLAAESAARLEQCIQQAGSLSRYYPSLAYGDLDLTDEETQRDTSSRRTYSHLNNRLERLGRAIAGKRRSAVQEFL
ncbi:hypothetical protein DVK00_19175 [Haloarcula sp. Atlit-47R]|uniref:hypothetical protein n=1 Tax=Haloarcula sp. Atlit-47R TaxID=2282132 RepID=UPI000EF20BF1|nr:hypothetical protein [Haloarcula sp. Atlit-47R]RLM41961.1 hypothetical protein DVK00_19175 [Haloarcula sp. Atlit-47R]